eukprot:345073-Rhodomonas_salina.2
MLQLESAAIKRSTTSPWPDIAARCSEVAPTCPPPQPTPHLSHWQSGPASHCSIAASECMSRCGLGC